MRWLSLVALLLASGCSSAQPTVSPSPPLAGQLSSSAPASPAASPSPTSRIPTPTPLTFHNSAAQARMVSTFVAFLDAYNAGRVDAALALMAENPGISDCDYRAVRPITADGTEAVRQWLRDRVADRDQLVLESVRNENPEPASGSHVVAVTYVRRTSDTLRALGFPNGIHPRLASKVVFTAADDRVRTFANGPGGGDPEFCRPRT
jgi:hypothetical protein